MIKNHIRLLWSPYTAFSLCLILSFPLFFLRGIGVFDDSVFLKIGELIVDGLIPYRDVFDNKPPGIYYLGAAIALISNSHWLASRIFLFLFAFVFGIWVIRYTHRSWGNLAAHLVAWIFGLSYTIAQGYSFHTDQFCAFFGFAAIMAISKERRQFKISWLNCGILISIAFIFKQVAVIYLAGIIFTQIAATLGQKLSWQSLLKRCILLVFGFAIIPLIVVIFTILNGIWYDFYDAVFNSALAFGQTPINLADTFILWLKIPSVLLTIPCVFLLLINNNLRNLLYKSTYLNDFLLLVVVGTLSLLPTLHQSSNTHYTGSSLVFLAISNSIILSYFWQSLKKRSHSRSIQLLSISIITSALLVYTTGVIWGGVIMIRQNRLAIDLAQMHEIRNILNSYLPNSEKILVLSDNPAKLYYISGRRPLIKYIYYYGSGWLNSKIPNLDDASQLLVKGAAPGAIIETPLNDSLNSTLNKIRKNYVNKYNNYKILEISGSVNAVNKSYIFLLIRQDFYKKSLKP